MMRLSVGGGQTRRRHVDVPGQLCDNDHYYDVATGRHSPSPHMIVRTYGAPHARRVHLRHVLGFTTLSTAHATKLLSHAGVDVANQAHLAGWRRARRPAQSRYSPRFRFWIDREQRAIAFDVQEVVGPSDVLSDVAGGESSRSTELTNGRRRTTILQYSHQVLPEPLIDGINKSLRFDTNSTQRLQLKFSLDALWRSFKSFEAEELVFTIDDYFDDVRFSLESMAVDTDALNRLPQTLVTMPKSDHLTELEKEAASQKLIYTELDGCIGCIVNGAGLAMATNDLVAHCGGRAANFLDTGGQATTDLLVRAFALLLSDSRVKAIVVNIFGGVIRCDMIAESIIRAADELDMQGTPIVVRLRGTNQEQGQRMIAESGLELYPVHRVDDAALKVIELAKETPRRKVGSTESRSDQKRTFSTKTRCTRDAERLSALRRFQVDATTRVIYQGFTGTVATSNAKATIAYGTRVVGGVAPGRGGTEHLGLPVFDTVKEAVEAVRPDATAIFVPAFKAKSAILEAIEAGIPIIVSVSEGIPIHDALQIHEALRASGRSRLIGPNCPGLIDPAAKVRIGIMPLAQFSPGSVGIISKSGTLSYEAVSETTEHGLGQSLVLGVGGDMLPGTSMVEALAAILPRQDTRAVILIGEIGGRMELEVAEWLARHREDEGVAGKPIVGLVVGHRAPPGRVMGHAGAVLRPGDPTAAEKEAALGAAGVDVVSHTRRLGTRVSELLSAV